MAVWLDRRGGRGDRLVSEKREGSCLAAQLVGVPSHASTGCRSCFRSRHISEREAADQCFSLSASFPLSPKSVNMSSSKG